MEIHGECIEHDIYDAAVTDDMERLYVLIEHATPDQINWTDFEDGNRTALMGAPRPTR